MTTSPRSATRRKTPFGTDWLNRYVDRVMRASQHDDHVVIRLNEVMAMVRSPLMSPVTVLRVLRSGLRSAVRSGPVPAVGTSAAPAIS
ncbi:MAG TPA: hypothetical protein VM287_05885 [Egibacteraceae bacterium]|jgi:hypothetical protein|nr:hypothetical protein [Egibacteraceae bacterium]